MDESIESESGAPPVRASSPSPSIIPTPAISSCTSPDRTFSTVSSRSASSATSADGRSSVSNVSSRRRGYIRTQGADFAESARHRESVMSLGSIAHLQYYFARTGLLDGKGGQAREWKKKQKADDIPRLLLTPNARFIEDLTESPTEETSSPEEEFDDDLEEEAMLPPTVSTYSVKTFHLPPPPDLMALRRDLLDALDEANKNMEEIGSQKEPPRNMKPPRINISPEDLPDTGDPTSKMLTGSIPLAWHEMQGVRILDVITLAIRAARIYYTAHERPERLASIKSEREIRQELFNVLEVLKRWASRNFTGGLRDDERSSIMTWMANVRSMLAQESHMEEAEAQEREGWIWADGNWTGKEREREETFLRSLLDTDSLPTWSAIEGQTLPTPMLEWFQDGRGLVQIHNQAVKKSKRPFGEIKSYHEDVAKPYRCADNIRYWLKAAEIRWETKLELDVMGVVYGNSDEAWKQFDTALLAWCKAVREELMRDWRPAEQGHADAVPPTDGLALDTAYVPMFTTSITTTAPTEPDSGPETPTSSSVSSQLFSSPPPPPPAVAVSPPENHPPRRIKSKSSLRSLRSVESSLHEEEADEIYEQAVDKSLVLPSILRRLSPGLAARVKLLDGNNKTAIPSRTPGTVGRIPEEQIKEIDSRNQNLSIKIEKKGRVWNGSQFVAKDNRPEQSDSTHLQLEPEPETIESPEESEKVKPDLEPQTTESPVEPETLEPAVAPETIELPVEPEKTEPAVAPETTVEPAPIEPVVQAEQPVEEPTATVEADLEPVTEEAEDQSPDSNDAEKSEEASMAVPDAVEPSPAPEPELTLDDITQDGHEPTDFEKYVQKTKDIENDNPPPPPPKDTPRPGSASSSCVDSYFGGSQRAESIFSFSRASFREQLIQLTTIPLPLPETLEANIAAIPTAPLAVKSLTGAAEKIRVWIKKASDVLSGLDSEDDVEWAAAAGREGLEGIDRAVGQFEDVQMRNDIGSVSADSLKMIVFQMDGILKSWAQIKGRLRSVKEQVELAMEWGELWNTVLGDVTAEIESLSVLLFEIEEKRELNMLDTMACDQESTTSGLDISELETIVEEAPIHGNLPNNRHSVLFEAPPTLDTPLIQAPHDDSEHSDLIAVFARIQPLKASLAFFPMRLSMFQCRAQRVFPSACEDLHARQVKLEKDYKVLEQEAEGLRKMFSEDRWVLVFRNAGNQARKMFLSVERSIGKLQEALEIGAHVHNPAMLAKRIESYEAKKQHYIPAIERVISLIDKGVQDQMSVNSETLNLCAEMSSRMDALKRSVEVMDTSLVEYNVAPGQHLRDSISTIVTMDSPATGSVIDTPGSSPPSSVILTPANGKSSATSLGSSSRRASSVSSVARSTLNKVRRYSGLPQATSTLTSKKSAIPKPSSLTAPSPSKMHRSITPTPTTRKRAPPPPPKDNRPRWNSSVNTNDLEVGHLRSSTPFRKPAVPSRTPRPMSMMSRRDVSASPAPTGRSASRVSSRFGSRSPMPAASPTPTRSLLDPPPYSKLRKPAATEGMNNTPRNRSSFAGPSFSRSVSQDHSRNLLSPTKATRPGTALGHSGSRRISLLPLPKNKSGRETPRSKLGERPPWR
ncbi:cortical protein KAR9-domain-containing protein [Aspergillus avenaceus]|uniref:Cortical protein KAR9-domain-containing protein n=1 Tax=Aspergillus avenaceus TaxID=36643 RepID=A0A5N6U5D2_ASPAV|nr:cortical protein KAR9-domain-containing protein [Aspergillus avenaceus]